MSTRDFQADCINSDGSIRHVDPHTMKEVMTESFLPEGKIVVGVTSGASTPDAYMQQVREYLGERNMIKLPHASGSRGIRLIRLWR